MQKYKFDLQRFAAPDVPKIETRLEVKNETGDVAEMYLYGTIRKAYPWEDENACISAKGVLAKLQGLKGKDINIHINSGGGDAFESIAICNSLKQHDGTVNIYIDSMAGSGASIIATAGKNVYMFPNCMQMIHKAWSIVAGNAEALRKEAETLDKIDTAVKASYMTRFVGTEDELERLLADETYLTADECLTFGLCTEVIKEQQEDQPQVSAKESLFAKYKNSVPGVGNQKPALFHAFKK